MFIAYIFLKMFTTYYGNRTEYAYRVAMQLEIKITKSFVMNQSMLKIDQTHINE